MKKLLFFSVLILLPMVASADAVEIDGIYYNLIPEEKSAEVTSNPDKYTGEVVIPESINYEDTDYSVTTIGQRAFSFCSSLTSVTIPNSVTSIGEWAFRNCKELENIVLPNQLESIGQQAFSYCEKLKDVIIPSSVKEISPMAFANCGSIRSFVVPEGITVIRDGTFTQCESLESVTLPNTLISIEQEAFASCNNLTSIELPSSLKSVGIEAFNGAGLTSLHIPASLTQMAFDGEYWPFTGSNLSSITVSEGNPVYDSRENCNAIIETATNKLILCCTSTTFPSDVTTIGKYAFHWVPLQNIEIPNTIQVIEEGAFSQCRELTQVKLPNALISMESFTFDGCRNLQSITLPESIQSIGESAFRTCRGLTSVTIPNSVTSIGYAAFAVCSGLTSIKVMATTPPTASSESFSKYTIPLYVPAESVDAYKAAEPWKNFETIVATDGTTPLGPEVKKCATPTIAFVDGELVFSCETEGVEYVYDVKINDTKGGKGEKVSLAPIYSISVYATKAGYEDSEVATKTIDMLALSGSGMIGDINGDGKIDIVDVTTLIDIILSAK